MRYPKFYRVIRKRYRALMGNKSTTCPSKNQILKCFLKVNKGSFIVSKTLVLNVDVAVYFEGSITNIYQIEQWVRVFTLLSEKKPMVILARHKPVYDWVTENTDLTAIYVRTIDDLQVFYERNTQLKCVLYVNHAFKNFQSLINNNVLHVHINHGESDKTSTTTNQVKAYDRVFIVADAAYDKYANNLLDADMTKFVKVGRPQLDGVKKLERPISDRKIILYAPTWEGTHESMNFSSIGDFGEHILNTILESDEYYLIYRPHPRSGTRNTEIGKINKRILKYVKEHDFAHADLESDSLSLCELADIAILDNSAVTVDYLKYNKPFILTDLFSNQEGARADKPLITQAARVINQNNLEELDAMIAEELREDSLKAEREFVRDQFIGNYSEGESSEKFITEITRIVELSDELRKARSEQNYH